MPGNSETTDREALLERVRIRAREIAARHPNGGCEFGPPCFVECYCWYEAELQEQANG